MRHPIVQDRERDAAFRSGGYHSSIPSQASDPDPVDDAVPPEIPASERNRSRVWRAISWILLVNVLLFWLMGCVTAFT